MDTRPIRLEMESPSGTRHMVTDRDRAAFEEKGYSYVGIFPGEPDAVAEPSPVAEGEASIALQPVAGPVPSAERKALAKMNKGELLALAESLGITDLSGTNRVLTQRIEEAEAAVGAQTSQG